MFEGRTPPAAIARQLRQESGFGCAACGCPIIEYHHIVEWSERKHFEPEHMVVLCPTCHAKFGKLNPEKAYRVKRNPFNLSANSVKEHINGKINPHEVDFGGFKINHCNIAITYCGIPMVRFRDIDGETALDFYFPKDNFWPEVEIVGNEAKFWTADLWDLEFRTNYFRFKRKNKHFLELDLRGHTLKVRGKFELHGKLYRLSEGKTEINKSVYRGNIAEFAEVGLALGEKRQVSKPNYAMADPKAIIPQ